MNSRNGWLGSVAASFAVLSALTAQPAEAQNLRELFCRGGPSGLTFHLVADPSPAGLDGHVRMELRYRITLNYRAGHPGTLQPGFCGWDTSYRAPRPGGRVHFDIEANAQGLQIRQGVRDTSLRAVLTYPDTASLRRYLSVPNHFWVFFVPDEGEPFAISYGPHEADLTGLFADSLHEAPTEAVGTTPPKREDATPLKGAPTTAVGTGPPPKDGKERRPGADPAAVTSRTVLKDIQVTPGLEGVAIRFTTGSAKTPFVAIGTEAPAISPRTGRYEFATWSSTRVAGRPNGGAWSYTVASSAPLARGTPHWFLIDVPAQDEGARPLQHVGQFSTLRQSVTISFGSIYVLSHRDASYPSYAPGKLGFELWACNDATGLGTVHLGAQEWPNGTRKRFAEEIVIENAPDRLMIRAEGKNDSPNPDVAIIFPLPGGDLLRGELLCNRGVGTYATKNYEYNTASAVIDLSKLAGSSNGMDLFLRSGRLRGGSTLMFDVTGYLKVTRQ